MKKILFICLLVSSLVADGFMDSVGDIVKSTLGKETSTNEKESSVVTTVRTIKETIGLAEEEEKSDNTLLDDIKDTLEIKEGESWGMPSILGFNEKKKKTFMGSEMLGDTILGDIQEGSSSIYKGFKTSGESAEFMSGVMYKSSKAYNTMFDFFDDSPFNIFEEEEEETSIFDVFEGGNKVLDMFD